MKIILSLIIGGALVVSGFGQTRNVLVGTNNAVTQPTNFWSADAVNARAGLGLGSAATNPASAFQPSSLNLSNLAANNGGGLTNLNATNIVGIVNISRGGTGATNASDARIALGLGTAATNPATAFQSSSTALSNLATGNGGALSNLQATNLVGLIPASNISTVTFTNIGGTLSIASGGTGATNAANARQNLGSTTVGDAVFIATNAAAARTSIGALASNDNGAGLTNLTAANITGAVAITNGGSGATTAGGARTNFGLGWSALTNSNVATSLLGLDISNQVVAATNIIFTNGVVFTTNAAAVTLANLGLGTNASVTISNLNAQSISITNTGAFRTNIGLGWPALTNSNAGTGLVSVNTNGEVVSPTNFWQVAPITTTFIETQPVTNSTTNISAARFLHIHSLQTNIFNVTNTINLPTNGATFNGDIALVVHQGPTSSMTRVRTLGSTSDLVTMTRFDEAVEFVYYNGEWEFNHNLSFIEPIYFSGTNAAANAAASRTNLGLGATWLTNTNVTNFRTAIGLGATNDPTFFALNISDRIVIGSTLAGIQAGTVIEGDSGIGLSASNDTTAFVRASTFRLFKPLDFSSNSVADTTRTNLSLGATNNVAFRNITSDGNITISNQSATNNGLLFIYRTNNEPFLGLANLIASNNTTISNETLFRVGVAEATNKAAQFGFRSTNTNGDGVAVFSVFGYNALMMIGPSERSATNASVEADIYSVSPTNRVATLIDTNTGAFSLHRAIQFRTNDSSVGTTNLVPATNNQIQKWLRVYIGTNTFYLPLYQ